MVKTKCKMKAKHDTKPGRVRHVSLEEYYTDSPEQVFMDSITALAAKAAKADLPKAHEMDLDELDAYILANAERR